MDDASLILASASPQRRKLLAELDLPFDVREAPLEEPAGVPPGVGPAAWACALSYYKARAVAEAVGSRWVLGADTVVACAGRLLGKPRDLADARRMLELQTGRESLVITGVSLIQLVHGAVDRVIRHATSSVRLRDDRTTRESYLESGGWRGKAGAYGIQDVGDALVERLEGSLTNVIGLPLELVREMLARCPALDGWSV